MRPLDLDQLRSYLVVVDAGSLSAGAPRLYRSQSAVSEQIRKLEERVGVTLLARGKKGVIPTTAGRRLLVHARNLLALSERALEDLHGIALEGDLHLAVTDYFRPGAIAEILKRLQAGYPNLRLHVTIRKSLLIEEEADSGDFDIGLSMSILDGRPKKHGVAIRREPLHWVASPDFKLDQHAVLPLLMLPDSCRLQQFVCQNLDNHQVPYTIAHTASGVAGLQSALSAGLGLSCLNASAIPEGAVICRDKRLPRLPEVEFSLAPPRSNERPLVSDARRMLTEKLA